MDNAVNLQSTAMTENGAATIFPRAETTLFLLNFKKVEGNLIDFDPINGTISITNTKTKKEEKFAMEEIKIMQLTESLPWPSLPDLLDNDDTSTAPLLVHTFSITFIDESAFMGEAFGYNIDDTGLHLFKKHQDNDYQHIYIPKTAIKEQSISEKACNKDQFKTNDNSLEDFLSSQKVITPAQLENALMRQRAMPQMRLGEILVSEQVITEEQLDEALNQQKGNKKMPLGEVLIQNSHATSEQIQQALGKKLGIPFIHMQEFQIIPDIVQLVPDALIQKHRVIPLHVFEGKLAVAMENPLNFDAIEALRFHTNKFIEPVMATSQDIDRAIKLYFASDTSVLSTLEEEVNIAGQHFEDEQHHNEDTETVADNIVVKLMNKIILDAHEQGVSDIHIEPSPGRAKTIVRFRKDGTLMKYHEFPAQYRNALISRIKVMAKLDISEKRKPQDGKINFKKYGPANIELRVATIPTSGDMEDIVMRILANGQAIPLTELGINQHNFSELKKIISKPYGLILVCGPTGSGKTTSLHSVLGELNDSERKIWTAEDPVEITQTGLRQVQINEKAGLSFPVAMRSFLRADPDIIMVGEMRDKETTSMGIEASLTGHLVLSTLHTNSAVESVTRLLDMGMDPFNFADALLGILAQRLAKSLCSNCKEEYIASDNEIRHLAHEYHSEVIHRDTPKETIKTINAQAAKWISQFGDKNNKLILHRAKGCESCNDTGYLGRFGLHELLVASPTVKHLILEKEKTSVIQAQARKEGLITLKQDGIIKVLQGITDYSKIRAVCIK